MRVLLVEDNPGDADIVRLALAEGPEAGAFVVDHVQRLSDALAAAAAPPRPDVVLLDLSLPDAVGLDGLRRLNEAVPETPVVVLTGADRAAGEGAIQAGAQDYLGKGVDAPLLPRALRYAVERHRHAARARLLAREQAARAAAEVARERMSLLAAASTAVSHSLEDRHALESLAEVLVPRLADWCALREDAEEAAPEWIVAHRDPAARAALPARIDAAVAAGVALAPARAELHAARSAGGAPLPWAAALDALGASSLIVAPLRMSDEVLGALVLGAAGRHFDADDLALAEEIGRRAGVALANCDLYREARLAVAARDEFMSVAAHELRTPVAVLQLKLQQVELKQQASACATCAHAVPADYAGAARQIARLGQVIESLLDVSRIVGSGVKLVREVVDLGEIAREVVERLQALAARGGSELALRCAGPVLGAWDRLAIERVLANLVTNAIKFGAARPVEVRIGSEGADAVMYVEDHGIGIAPRDIDRIFAQFERAVSSRHFAGLGLGLYVTRQLVQAHGGTITVASQPGSGATFTVRLPRELAAS